MITFPSVEQRESLPTLPDGTSGEWVSRTNEGQVIGARLFVPETVRSDREIIIDGIAYSVHASKPIDVHRTAMLAESSQMITLGLELPGMSPYSGPLTDEQEGAIKHGDWSVLGRAQWELIEETLSQRGITYSEDDPITVHYAGFSMSASSNIGLIASAPVGVKTGHVVAWENTAWVDQPATRLARTRRVAQLILGMIHGAKGLKEYQSMSQPHSPELKASLQSEERNGFRPKITQKLSQKFGAWVVPVLGMARGGDAQKLADVLTARDEQEHAKVHIWHGEKSKLSRTLDNGIAYATLRLAGIDVELETDVDGRHGVEDATRISVPRYVEAFTS